MFGASLPPQSMLRTVLATLTVFAVAPLPTRLATSKKALFPSRRVKVRAIDVLPDRHQVVSIPEDFWTAR